MAFQLGVGDGSMRSQFLWKEGRTTVDADSCQQQSHQGASLWDAEQMNQHWTWVLVLKGLRQGTGQDGEELALLCVIHYHFRCLISKQAINVTCQYMLPCLRRAMKS